MAFWPTSSARNGKARRRRPPGEDITTDDSDLLAVYRQYDAKSATEEPEEPPLFLLAPQRLATLAQRGHLTARTGYYVLKDIMKIICVRHDMDEEMALDEGRTIAIGGEISPVHVTTVELRYAKEAQIVHDVSERS